MADAQGANGEWLELMVSKKTYAKLAAYGRSVGTTANGYAKLLVLVGMRRQQAHEKALMAAAESLDADSSAISGIEAGPDDKVGIIVPPQSDAALWHQAIQRAGGYFSDHLPAPRQVDAGVRTYHADDFSWPDGVRPKQLVHQVDLGASSAAQRLIGCD